MAAAVPTVPTAPSVPTTVRDDTASSPAPFEPPDAVETTLEALPAGWWDDAADTPEPAPDTRRASSPAPARTGSTASAAPVAPEAPVTPAPAEAAAPEVSDPAVPGTPPALAQLEGIALLRAVFPGRLVRVERGPAGAEGDAAAADAADDVGVRPERGPADDAD